MQKNSPSTSGRKILAGVSRAKGHQRPASRVHDSAFDVTHFRSGSNPPTRRSGWPIGGPLDDFWLRQKLPEIVQTIARSQLRFKPGSKFEYSNSALFVLGRVIEVVSGKPYAAYVKEKILEPLEIIDTHYAPPPDEARRVAVIYARRDGQRETIFRFNRP